VFISVFTLLQIYIVRSVPSGFVLCRTIGQTSGRIRTDREKLEPLYAAEAKERQREGGMEGGKTAGRGRPTTKGLPKKLGKPKHDGEAADRAAKAANSLWL